MTVQEMLYQPIFISTIQQQLIEAMLKQSCHGYGQSFNSQHGIYICSGLQ